ncbi:MAG: aminoglycoside phosphotransferase family protein [Acidimicrobiales bacterium]
MAPPPDRHRSAAHNSLDHRRAGGQAVAVLEVPPVVQNKARAAGAQRWLTELPALVGELQERWQITTGAVYSDGTEALVLEAERADGTPAVLKLMVPRNDAAAHEITVLRLAGGRGCVRLLEDDVGAGVLLLERLGRSLFQIGLPVAQRHEILCSTAAQVWRPAADCGLPTGAEKGRWLIDHISRLWDELDRPCSERVVDHARACAERRIAAHDEERAVLVHGDVHQWNTLEHPAGGFTLVDPDGLLADAEYDLGILMREDPVELLEGDPRDRAHWLAARTGLDVTAIWEWGVVERVSTGLTCLEVDLRLEGTQMLATAEAVAE